MTNTKIRVTQVRATQAPNSFNFLRGDGVWSPPWEVDIKEWDEWVIEHTDFSADDGIWTGGNPTDLTLNSSGNVVLKTSGGGQGLWWKRNISTYKTVDRSLPVDYNSTGAQIFGVDVFSSPNIDGQTTYLNCYSFGYHTSMVTGTLTFDVLVRGGMRVWVNGFLQSDNWDVADETIDQSYSFDVPVVEGERYFILVHYFNGERSARWRINLSSPGMSHSFGSGEWRYRSSGHGVTNASGVGGDTSTNSFYDWPAGYEFGLTLESIMAFDYQLEDDASISFILYYGGNQYSVDDGSSVQVGVHSGMFKWRYSLYSTYGEKTPILSSIGMTIEASNPAGIVLPDRTTGVLYRIFVDNGAITIEPA
jgi:single-stranded DNA-binding protein